MKTANENIFESPSQTLPYDAADIRLIWDRCLVKDIPDENKIGSIWIPETAAERGVGKRGLLRMGIVVAVGPGDPWASEKIITARQGDVMGGNQVVRKSLGTCPTCANGFIITTSTEYPHNKQYPAFTYKKCTTCKGDGIRRWPMQVKVGDRVIVDRRKESEFYFNGERMWIVHEEQAILAVLEESK